MKCSHYLMNFILWSIFSPISQSIFEHFKLILSFCTFYDVQRTLTGFNKHLSSTVLQENNAKSYHCAPCLKSTYGKAYKKFPKPRTMI